MVREDTHCNLELPKDYARDTAPLSRVSSKPVSVDQLVDNLMVCSVSHDLAFMEEGLILGGSLWMVDELS